MKPQLIEWLDHNGDASWQTVTEAGRSKPATCETVGWLVHEDALRVVVADTRSEDEVCGSSVILKSCIVKRRTIRA